jgi:hypothetical protein
MIYALLALILASALLGTACAFCIIAGMGWRERRCRCQFRLVDGNGNPINNFTMTLTHGQECAIWRDLGTVSISIIAPFGHAGDVLIGE